MKDYIDFKKNNPDSEKDLEFEMILSPKIKKINSN
jgi:hypothetical protein